MGFGKFPAHEEIPKVLLKFLMSFFSGDRGEHVQRLEGGGKIAKMGDNLMHPRGRFSRERLPCVGKDSHLTFLSGEVRWGKVTLFAPQGVKGG